jgi:hypothetical protein
MFLGKGELALLATVAAWLRDCVRGVLILGALGNRCHSFLSNARSRTTPLAWMLLVSEVLLV